MAVELKFWSNTNNIQYKYPSTEHVFYPEDSYRKKLHKINATEHLSRESLDRTGDQTVPIQQPRLRPWGEATDPRVGHLGFCLASTS